MSIIHAIRTAVTIGMIVTLAIHPAFIVPSGYGDGLASKVDAASASCVACGCCQSKSPESLCCCCKAEEKPTAKTSKGDANQDVGVEVNQTAWAAECECGTMVPPRHHGQERSEQEVVRHSSSRVPDRIEYSFNAAVPSPLQAMLHGANSCLLNFSLYAFPHAVCSHTHCRQQHAATGRTGGSERTSGDTRTAKPTAAQGD